MNKVFINNKKKEYYYYSYKYMIDKTSSLIRLFTSYDLSEKPIMIFATRRGGSSLMMRSIYSQPEVDYINLPLNLMDYHPYKNKIPRPRMKNRFISLNKNEEKMLFEYFDNLFKGKYILRNQWNVLDPDFSFHVKRFVIKELLAKTLMDWFTEKFDVEIIYLIRHPIPTALSAMKFGFSNISEAFLKDEYFKERFLDSEKEKKCYNILKNGSMLENHVMDWCLDNLYALNHYKKRPWLTVTYEEMLLRKKQISELMCSYLDLPDPTRMHNKMLLPAGASTKKSKEYILSKNQGRLVERWLPQTTKQDLDKIERIFDMFNIKIYSAYNAYPDRDVCHFGPLKHA